jgi:prepilin-type N-terminal cleavage/methylation domain-containing protein/prepilin-type processing-associated H-X9-DG protein
MSCGSKRGFSLIELLVVIAVVTLLTAMLLPTLNVAREFARGLYCSDNLRQLTLANMMYSQDNHDTWPGRANDSTTDFDNTLKCWVPCGHATDPQFDLKKGMLYPLVKNPGLYRCLSDVKPSNGLSYSMNANLYALCAALPGPAITITYPKPEKFTQAADRLVVFVDEAEPSDGNFKPIGGIEGDIFADEPQWYHNNRTSFGFCDGHTELRGKDDTVIGNHWSPCWFPVVDNFERVTN